MRRKALLLVCALLAAIWLWPAAPAYSQDLGSELAAALAANEQAVATIQQAEGAASPSVARVLVLQAVSQAQASRTALVNALAFATTDEQRSRIEGLIDHLDAAISAGLEAQTASDERISSIAAAVRGEVFEALSELRPFAPEAPVIAPSVAAPRTLPQAGEGWADPMLLIVLIASGLASLIIGLKTNSYVHAK